MWSRASGTRAALRGTRLEVIHVVRLVAEWSEAEAAEWFGIAPAQVRAVMRYYRSNQELVDGWIREHDEGNAKAYAEWTGKAAGKEAKS